MRRCFIYVRSPVMRAYAIVCRAANQEGAWEPRLDLASRNLNLLLRWLLCTLSTMCVPPIDANETVSVCEVLSHCGRYNGQTITVRGRYFANRHGRWFLDEKCTVAASVRPFAVADWTRSRVSRSLNPIVVSRDGSGRPTILSGIVTAVVSVQCVDQSQIERLLTDDSEPGLIQDGRIATAILYVLRVTESKPNEKGSDKRDSRSR
jgi:hypothetical protein